MTATARLVPVVVIVLLVLMGTACSSQPPSNSGTSPAAAKSSTRQPGVIEYVAHTGNDLIDAELHNSKKNLRPLYEKFARANSRNNILHEIPEGADLGWEGFRIIPAQDHVDVLNADDTFLRVERELRKEEDFLKEYGIKPFDVLSLDERMEIMKPHQAWQDGILEKFKQAGLTETHPSIP